MNVTAMILGDPPADLEQRRQAAAARDAAPDATRVIRNRRPPGSGKPVRKG